MSTQRTDFQTPVWLSDGLSFPYAETDHGVKQNTGVCFSGGGTRSMAATIGQLRGLNALKMISNIDYISCVSGGSWASGVYTYYKTNPPGGAGPINDEQFLQGPLSDAMTHAGQLAMLRRVHGVPVPSENFIFAKVSPENLSSAQALPASPDVDWRAEAPPQPPGPSRKR